VRYDEFMDQSIVTAYGGKILKLSHVNAHHWTAKHEADYQAFLVALKAEFPSYTDEQLAAVSNQRDYERYIDYILSGNEDPHWKQQTDLSKDGAVFIPNIIVKFEDINTVWASYVGGTLPKVNSWQNIETTDYRVADLQAHYSDDLTTRSAL
jgi:hypothetical protein